MNLMQIIALNVSLIAISGLLLFIVILLVKILAELRDVRPVDNHIHNFSFQSDTPNNAEEAQK